MAGATLPEFPKGREFEEYVAAVFQAAGYFLERDITEREEIEILQLDSISTDYDNKPPIIRLIEAKSGDWGFKDIFKIKGWMTYLDIEHGTLITSMDRDRFESYQNKSKKMGIDLIFIDDPSNFNDWFKIICDAKVIDQRDVWSWRYYYWLERMILNRTRAQKNGQPSAKRFNAILDYAFEINSGVFFNDTIAGRVEALYDSYGRNRTLAACCGQEMLGKEFSPEGEQIPQSIFRDTFYDCKYNEIQSACMVEQYARLTLLKAVVDYLCYKSTGCISKADKTIILKLKDKSIEIPLASFPGRFDIALNELGKDLYYHRYPVFWQWFLGVFGGFILKDYEKEEYEMLSNKSGIPIEEINNAFEAWDKLFPNKGGWFREDKNSNIRFLMLYPIPMRGVGANFRRVLYTSDAKYESLKISGTYTKNDLIKWNNAAVQLLSSSVSVVRKG